MAAGGEELNCFLVAGGGEASDGLVGGSAGDGAGLGTVDDLETLGALEMLGALGTLDGLGLGAVGSLAEPGFLFGYDLADEFVGRAVLHGVVELIDVEKIGLPDIVLGARESDGERGAACQLNFCHELGDELEAVHEGVGFRALDAAFGQGVEDGFDGDDDAGIVVEVGQAEGLLLAQLQLALFVQIALRIVVAAESGAVDGGCFALPAVVEGLEALRCGHTFSP